MSCCRNECTCLSVILSIIAGVLLGVLYSLGFVTTGIIFWVYLAIGVAGVFLSPLYAAGCFGGENERCFCCHRKLLLTAAVGTIITAAAGLIIASLTSVIAIAIILGLTTFFAVLLLISLICLARCLCDN